MDNEHKPIEQMEVFLRYVEVADWAWHSVQKWPPLARDTIGKQLLRAADSVGANLVEGDGRYSLADGIHFFVIARASARETRYWLQRAAARGLVSADETAARMATLTSATQLLNRLITYRRKRKTFTVTESAAAYTTTDPFAEPDETLPVEEPDPLSSRT